ncbi:hypothetical protein [Bradyrhizobium sp. F1.13.3]|uniref:hypothetical protein n=1 Tax=Bradyrhizobium sp. F1.13.3 TaxID=3156351 RepID=UPI003394B33D
MAFLAAAKDRQSSTADDTLVSNDPTVTTYVSHGSMCEDPPAYAIFRGTIHIYGHGHTAIHGRPSEKEAEPGKSAPVLDKLKFNAYRKLFMIFISCLIAN